MWAQVEGSGGGAGVAQVEGSRGGVAAVCEPQARARAADAAGEGAAPVPSVDGTARDRDAGAVPGESRGLMADTNTDARPGNARVRRVNGRGALEEPHARIDVARQAADVTTERADAMPIDPRGKAVGEKPGVRAVEVRTGEVAREIVQEARLLKYPERTEVEIRLKPEWLGRVTLRVASQDGRISARFAVGHDGAKAEIESRLGELRRSMVEQGLEISEISVSVDGGRHWSGQGYWGAQQDMPDRAVAAATHFEDGGPTASGSETPAFLRRCQAAPGSLDLIA